jgi:hypothetical protein
MGSTGFFSVAMGTRTTDLGRWIFAGLGLWPGRGGY